MRHWLQLATRSWRAKPGRTAASLVAVALGVGTVVTMTAFYESISHAITDQVVTHWLGNTHVTVQSPGGHWGRVPQALADPIAQLDNVEAVTPRLARRVNLLHPPSRSGVVPPSEPSAAGGGALPALRSEVDAIGVIPATESTFRSLNALRGRRIQSEECGAALVEARLVGEVGLALGESFLLEIAGRTHSFTLVGTFERPRVGAFQRPEVQVALADLQKLRGEPGVVTIIDVMVEDTSPEALAATAQRIEDVVRESRASAQVLTAAARMNQLQEAQRTTELILILVAFVALLTSFFIIITTMGMGIVERMTGLGMMRCVGVTRGQLTGLVLAELLPVGILGTVMGVPIGIALTHLGALLVPEYVQTVLVSTWGVQLAVAGGLLTTLTGSLVLVVQVGRVSPLSAASPESQPPRRVWALGAAVAGLLSLGAHHWMLGAVNDALWFKPIIALCGTITIYFAYVLVVPGLVVLIGPVVLGVVGPLLGVHRKLARDQIGRAPWRSAGICWMLMVGLSLIVYLAVRGESINAAWDFPSRLAEAFVWTQEPIPASRLDAVRGLPGVGEVTAIHDIRCTVGRAKNTLMQLLKPFTIFVAGEPDTFLNMAKLEFLEGDPQEARAKLKRGGYVLLPPESSRGLNLHYGDRVDITIGSRTASFEVAGVVQSPALDIAVSYFQADSYMTLAAGGAVLGTLEDTKDRFMIDAISTFLLTFDLPAIAPPAEFAQAEPPGLEAKSIAGRMMGWAKDLPHEGGRLAEFADVLGAFRDGSGVLSPPAGREVRRYQRALAFVAQTRARPVPRELLGRSLIVAEHWEDLTPAERWDLFREQLTMLKVAYTAGKPGSQTGSLRRLKQSIDNDIRRATLLVSIIPIIALIVATIGVANLIAASVSARTRQIAVLRAVGALKSQIVRLVLAEAMTLGVMGCLIGVVLGLHTANSMNVITEKLVGVDLVFTVPWGRVAGAVSLTLVIALLAGVGPARRAARNNIVDALQS
ncbi:MAG: ABC transporter permease, partial [bacterium]|nr:ABC transporter permease [bacterium]